MKRLDDMQRLVRKYLADQRFVFLLVGGANTAFSTILFVVLVMIFHRRYPSTVYLAISWTTSLILAFFAYRLFVFRVSGRLIRDFFRYLATSITGLALNLGLLAVFVDTMHWPAIPVQVVVTCTVVVFTYFGHKHISFRRG